MESLIRGEKNGPIVFAFQEMMVQQKEGRGLEVLEEYRGNEIRLRKISGGATRGRLFGRSYSGKGTTRGGSGGTLVHCCSEGLQGRAQWCRGGKGIGKDGNSA